MGRRTLQILSSIVLFSGLVAAVSMCRKLVDSERLELRGIRQSEAQHTATQLRAGVLQAFEPLTQLAKWWSSQGKPLDSEDWRTDGQLFLSRSPGLRQAIWIGRDGLQHWSAIPGTDPDTRVRRPDPRLRSLLASNKAPDGMVVSPIFADSGNRAAFYVSLPIHGGSGKFVAGLFDAATLVSTIKAHGLPAGHRMSVRSGGTGIFSDVQGLLPSADEVQASFPVGAETWSVSLQIPQRHFDWFTGQVFAVICVVVALLYAFVILLHLSQKRSAELERTNHEIDELNRALKHRVAEFQTLLDVIPVGIAVSQDTGCGKITVNPALARILGVPQERTLSLSDADSGQPPWRLTRDGRELQRHELPMQVAMATGKVVRAEEDRVIRADGTTVDVLSYASPLFDDDGRVRGVLSAWVDISDRKAQEQLRTDLERRLQRHERVKSLGIMAAGIAHDFNNLLTTIIGQASLAISDGIAGASGNDNLEALLEAAQRAAVLVRQIMAYTGNSFHSLRATDLATLVHGWSGISNVTICRIPEMPQVMADPDEIHQAIQNLVSNATEASKEARIEITVDTYRMAKNEPDVISPDRKLDPGLYARIIVKDSGAGMPAEIAERAFDPFFSTKFLGRGLGLSEVLGIMRSHQGALRLRTAPGAGTSVELFFPLADRAVRAA